MRKKVFVVDAHPLTYPAERLAIVEIVALMYQRYLTDSTGGNLAVRVSDRHLLITPSMMGREKRHRIMPEDLLLLDLDDGAIEGAGVISREVAMHLGIHRTVPGTVATIHAHPRYALVFAAVAQPIPVMLESLDRPGPVEVVPYAPGYTPQLAENVIAHFSPRAGCIEHGIAAVLPRHGVIVAHTSLDKAYDLLERVEANAVCALFGPRLDGGIR